MTKYQVVTAESYRVIASGFKTLSAAYKWVNIHDCGQFENDGGLVIIPYEG